MAPFTSLAIPRAPAVLQGTPAYLPFAAPTQVDVATPPATYWPTHLTLDKRQASSVPTCAVTCLNTVDQVGCDSIACMCRSEAFLGNVQTCLSETCPSASDWNAAYYAVGAYCQQYGVTVSSTSIDSAPTQTATNGDADPTATTPTATESPAAGVPGGGEEPFPTVRTQNSTSTMTVDIVMGSICSAVLALALAVGAYNIRQMSKKEQEHSQLGSRSYTHAGTQMSHLKSYNNFDFDPTRTTQSTRSAFAAGPSRGKGGNRGHDLTHLDARAFNSFPRIPEEGDCQIHVHTATTVETTPVSAEFPPMTESEDGVTVHLAEQDGAGAAVVPVLPSSSVQFVVEEEIDSEKEDGKVKGK